MDENSADDFQGLMSIFGSVIGNLWSDMPASYHNGAAGFSFADGHSEIHKWVEPVTKQPITITVV